MSVFRKLFWEVYSLVLNDVQTKFVCCVTSACDNNYKTFYFFWQPVNEMESSS